jgi:hypothetical protein
VEVFYFYLPCDAQPAGQQLICGVRIQMHVKILLVFFLTLTPKDERGKILAPKRKGPLINFKCLASLSSFCLDCRKAGCNIQILALYFGHDACVLM